MKAIAVIELVIRFVIMLGDLLKSAGVKTIGWSTRCLTAPVLKSQSARFLASIERGGKPRILTAVVILLAICSVFFSIAIITTHNMEGLNYVETVKQLLGVLLMRE